MKLNRWLMPILGAVLFFGSYGVGLVTNTWSTSGKAAVVAGQLTPADLKGWMTIREAAAGLGVPAPELLALVEAPAGSGVTVDTAFKDLEALVPGFSLTTFRTKVATWLTTRTGTVSPPPTQAASPSTVPAPSSTATAVVVPSTHPATGTPTGTGTGGTGGGSGSSITGGMTLRQVAVANGIAVERLLAECGLPPTTDPDLTLKALKDAVPGFEIQTVRDAVQRIKG